MTASHQAAKQINEDLTAAIAHADVAYGLAKQLRVNWEESLFAEITKLAEQATAVAAAADAARAALAEQELAKLRTGPAKCPAYSYPSAVQEENTTAEKCTAAKCTDYKGKQTMTVVW